MRLWLMTFTQDDARELDWKEWNIVERKYRWKLDREERKFREVLDIDEWKRVLEELNEKWAREKLIQKEKEFCKLLHSLLLNFPYQDSESSLWFPNKLLKSKEIQCLWFSLIIHAILSELWIRHKSISTNGHVYIQVLIWWKKYKLDWAMQRKGKVRNHLFSLLPSDENTPQSATHEEALLSQLYDNMWSMLYRSWNLEEAIQANDKSIKLVPEAHHAYYNKWVILNSLWRYSESIEMYKTSLEINPEDPLAYRCKWDSLVMVWDYSEAMACYDEAIALDSKLWSAYHNKWLLLKFFWNKREADKCFELAKKYNN